MKITKSQLKQIIKEELQEQTREREVLNEIGMEDIPGISAAFFFGLIWLYAITGKGLAVEDFWHWVKEKHGEWVARKGQELVTPEEVEMHMQKTKREPTQ
jgi:hypothetical protein